MPGEAGQGLSVRIRTVREVPGREGSAGQLLELPDQHVDVRDVQDLVDVDVAHDPGLVDHEQGPLGVSARGHCAAPREDGAGAAKETRMSADSTASAVHLKALDPFDFLGRAAFVYPEKTAVIDGEARRTYPQFLERVNRLAAALQAMGIRGGE